MGKPLRVQVPSPHDDLTHQVQRSTRVHVDHPLFHHHNTFLRSTPQNSAQDAGHAVSHHGYEYVPVVSALPPHPPPLFPLFFPISRDAYECFFLYFVKKSPPADAPHRRSPPLTPFADTNTKRETGRTAQLNNIAAAKVR